MLHKFALQFKTCILNQTKIGAPPANTKKVSRNYEYTKGGEMNADISLTIIIKYKIELVFDLVAQL